MPQHFGSEPGIPHAANKPDTSTHTHINAGAGLKIPHFNAHMWVCVCHFNGNTHTYATNGIASSLIPGPAMQNMPAL